MSVSSVSQMMSSVTTNCNCPYLTYSLPTYIAIAIYAYATYDIWPYGLCLSIYSICYGYGAMMAISIYGYLWSVGGYRQQYTVHIIHDTICELSAPPHTHTRTHTQHTAHSAYTIYTYTPRPPSYDLRHLFDTLLYLLGTLL